MDLDSEFELSEELKWLCEKCGNSWKEKNLKESARILHQLGLVYKEKCFTAKQCSIKTTQKTLEKTDKLNREIKITFIQCAALLNCALVRQPATSEQIKEDLHSVCSEILSSAKAEKQSFDLVHFAEKLKENIEIWREDVKRQTKAIMCITEDLNERELIDLEKKKIKDVECLQEEITEKYKEFMQQVSQTCINILGDIPCHFTLVGMGSMARKEITPYSDFECVILLQEGVQKKPSYRSILEYFRWYAVIFQVILINLGETILPSVAISSLNDYTQKSENWFFDAHTKRGISFDGMMPHASKSPLGRQPTENKPWTIELIQPTSVMVNYSTQESDLKNGYHLADILSNTCFVDGSRENYRIFEKAVRKILTEKRGIDKQEITKMIKDDMQKHSTKLGISSTIDKNSYNVKQFAYRSTTIFISGFAQLLGVKPGSCFEVVRRMYEQEHISEKFSHKLQYAVALACEIRLKTYLDQGYQYDYVEWSARESLENVSTSLINAVGKRSCYDYLEIACCLQYDAVACFGLQKRFMFFHPVTMCITIRSFLNMHDACISAAHDYLLTQSIEQHQPSRIDDSFATNEIDDNDEDADFWTDESCCLHDRNQKRRKRFSAFGMHCDNQVVCAIQLLHIKLGSWYEEMQNFNQKLTDFYPFQSPYFETAVFSQADSENVISKLCNIGSDLIQNEVYFEAQYCYKCALKILQNSSKNSLNPKTHSGILYSLGLCMYGSKDFVGAKQTFLEAINLYQSLPNDQIIFSKDFEGNCFMEVGKCECELGIKDQASKSFKSALKCYKPFNSKNASEVEFCFLNLSLCLFSLNKFAKALVKFETLLNVIQVNDNNELRRAKCLYHLSRCLQNLGRFDEASKKLNEAIQIYQKNTLNDEKGDRYLASLFGQIAKCFQAAENYTQAENNFLQSLQFWEKLNKTHPDAQKYVFGLAACYQRIGDFYLKYNFFEKAEEHYKTALKLFKSLKENEAVEKKVCSLYGSLRMIYCEFEMYEKACKYCKKGLEIATDLEDQADLYRNFGLGLKHIGNDKAAHFYTNKALNTYKMLNKFQDGKSALKGIGLCWKDLNNNEEARRYLTQYIEYSKDSTKKLSLQELFSNASVLRIIGITWQSDNDFHSAVDFFLQSLKIFQNLPKSLICDYHIAWLRNKIGNHRLHEKQSEKAMQHFKSVEALFDSLTLTAKGTNVLACSYKYQGQLYFQKKSYENGIERFQKAEVCLLSIQKQNKYLANRALFFYLIGQCFEKTHDYSKAIENLKVSLDIYEALTKPEYHNGAIADVLLIMVKCQLSLKQNTLASKSYERFRKIHSELGKEKDLALALIQIGKCYERQSSRRQANDHFREAQTIFEKLGNPQQYQNRIDFLNSKLNMEQHRYQPDRRRLHHQRNYKNSAV